jgi:glucan phosphoethanolaminetransferase (alkaline phosphatase superfamily)
MERLKNKISTFYKIHKKQILFYVLLNVVFVAFITLSSYVHIPLSGYKDRLLYGIHIVLLQFSLSGYIYLATLHKWLFRLLFIPCFFILSLFAYWTYTQDISITHALVEIVLETKPSMVKEMLSIPVFACIGICVIVIVLLHRLYTKIQPIKINAPFVAISVVSIVSFFIIENKRGNTLKSRLPYNVIYGVKDYLKKEPYHLNRNFGAITSEVDSLKIVLVLGETVRADHLQLNGYHRATNPLLAKRKNTVSYANVYTPHTYTSSSLPRIITDASVEDKTLDTIVSVFDVFKQCKYNTLWVGNQELESSYSTIVKTNENVIIIDSLRSVLSFNKVLDEELLVPFKTKFSTLKGNGLFTLHMIGSHWWYENRYTDKHRKFKPTIDSKHIPSVTKAQMINSYDNTIVYLDFFLDEIIKTLEKEKAPSCFIYLSDHGESLGEDGKWMHGQNTQSTKNPAMIVWYSEKFKEKYPDKIKALQSNRNKHLPTDVLFHSMLDLIEIKGFKYQASQSIFALHP